MNSSLIFTKTNCAIALNLKPAQIKQILIDCNPVQVVAVIDGNEHILVVKKYEALKALASTRKERSTNLSVEQNKSNGLEFRCKGYKIQAYKDRIECECKDWANIASAANTQQVACKRTYAVLSLLGQSSLASYVKAMSDNGTITKLHTTLGRVGSLKRDYPLQATDAYNLSRTEASIDNYDC